MGTIVGGRYRLKTLHPGRSIQPPSAISRSSINIALPGNQVICSTGWFRSSQVDADIRTGRPFLFTPTWIFGRRAFTLGAAHICPVGVKMYECIGM